MAALITVACIDTGTDEAVANIHTGAEGGLHVGTIERIHIHCKINFIFFRCFNKSCYHIIIIWSATIFCTDRNFAFCTVKSITNTSHIH